MTNVVKEAEEEEKRERGGDDLNRGMDRMNGEIANRGDGPFNEIQSREDEPCLPIVVTNGTNSSANGRRGSQTETHHFPSKVSSNLLESEKEERIYYSKNPVKSYQSVKKNGTDGRYRNWESAVGKKLGLTRCGLIILFLLLCAIIVIIAMGATWPRLPHRLRFPICVNSPCLRSSALMLSKMDKTVSPCEDFYGFTSGQWAKKHSKPPPGRSKWGLEEEMNLKLSEMIQKTISDLPHQTRTNSLTWKISNFYDSCMSLDDIERDNDRPLIRIINELGGWSVLRNFQVLSWEFRKTLVKLYKEYRVEPFFSISVVANPKNATRKILKLSPSGLGLPHISYYYREKDDRMSSGYRRYMKDVARQLGATSTDANSFSEDMFYYERRIAEATPTLEELEDVRNHQVHNLTALKFLAPSVPLHEILDAMFSKENINDQTEVLLSSTAYFSKISNIIATTDKSSLNNYVIWNLVKEYLPYLSQIFQNIYSVYNREVTGATKLVDRWEFCIKALQSFVDVGLVAQVEKGNTLDSRSENGRVVREIFGTVRKVVRESITKAQWIDLELYKHFISKLDNATVQVGFSEEYLDSDYLEEYYSKFYVETNNFFQNILYGVNFLQEEKRRKYVSPKEEYEWLSPVASATKVLFIPSLNKFVIPQKLLNKPYYEPDYPMAVLYGTLGVEISKGLVYSLLKYSGLYAANGSLVDDRSLVANLSLIAVDYQTRCLTDLSVENGVTTLERANKTSLNTFAAISAVRQALKALKMATTGSEHVHQAGLEDFDDESLFYIAYGQSLFSVKTMQVKDVEDTVSTHLGGENLMEMIKLQLSSFGEAFGCGTPRNACKHIL